MTKRRLGRPPGVDGAQTTLAILDEAERQFASIGYGAATNKTIATACGVTHAAVYHYFGTKPELYRAVCGHVYPAMVDAYREALTRVQGFRPQLTSVLEVSVELNRRRPSWAGFVMSGPVEARRHPEIAPIVKQHFAEVEQLLRQLVEAGNANGELHDSVETSDIADMLLSILHGFAHLAYSGGSPSRHARVVRSFELLLDGVLVTAKP